MLHEDCPIGEYDHERHYLGRNVVGIPQRCEGFEAELVNETGWTGR